MTTEVNEERRLMESLAAKMKDEMPAIIKEFNEVGLHHLEQSWRRPFSEEFANESQPTVEVTKAFNRPLNNTMCEYVRAVDDNFEEMTTDGYDYVYCGVPIEDKNSFSAKSNTWVGNGFGKVNWHLLKRFRVDETGKIQDAFVGLVNLSDCGAKWSDRKITTNRSTLSFRNEDIDNFIVVWGDVETKRKNLGFVMEKVDVG